jgi:hypothetical protein
VREISVFLGRDTYNPGDRVDGSVVLLCDESFDCNSVNVQFVGKERSRVVTGSGKHRRVYVEEIELVDQFLELKQESTIQEGESRFEFAFQMPQDALASYTGTHGHIQYAIRAKVEVSWALDPKMEVQIPVMTETPTLQPVSLRDSLIEDEKRLLEVDVPRDVVNPGAPMKLEVRLTDEIDFRGLRCEILHEERVAPEGKEERYRMELAESYTEEFRLPRHVPIEIEMQTKDSWPRAFQSALITCTYILKVTLDIAWKLDKVIEVPLRYGRTEKEDDAFIDFGFDF